MSIVRKILFILASPGRFKVYPPLAAPETTRVPDFELPI
jgi:hypothetical protein